ncbi:helix-turn-helix domain-containing protein [Antarctobacter jejuensis]|uniref:helix-turn-helix domain-containing protein n=1 Tax=Antarctobacter jejuensis TaxID=1439938 RepID=UPI003FD0E6CE
MKPIRKPKDHLEAKSRVEELMLQVSDGNAEAVDDLEVLVALIEAYERNNFPNHIPSAIDAIRFRIEQLGMTQRDLEPYIGSKSRVSDVMNGARNLSTDMMRALHEGLGIPYEALMKKSVPVNSEQIEVKAPVLKRLRENGLNLKQTQVKDFLSAAFGGCITPALNRKTRTQRASGKTDLSALLMWQAAVLSRARRESFAPFSRENITADFLRSLARCSSNPDGPADAIAALRSVGVIVVVFPVLPGTFLDGAAMLLDGTTPVVGLTLRHDRVDNFWFTLLHEMSHLLLHHEALETPGHAFFDEVDLRSEDHQEREADDMALKSLIPSSCASSIHNPYASTQDIQAVANCAGVHVSIAAGRWQKEHENYKKFSRLIERNTLRERLLA